MKIKPYIVINSRGGVRVVKTNPKLDFDEIAMQIHIEIPNELFNKPRLEASLIVPKDAVKPTEITMDVIDNMTEAIKKNTGVEVLMWTAPKRDDEE